MLLPRPEEWLAQVVENRSQELVSPGLQVQYLGELGRAVVPCLRLGLNNRIFNKESDTHRRHVARMPVISSPPVDNHRDRIEATSSVLLGWTSWSACLIWL